MNRTQYVDTLKGYSVGTVVGSQLVATNDREVPQGDPRLSNPFEDFEAVYPMAPCRSITVTPEMVAADAAERAERERRHRDSITWTPPVPFTRPEPKAVAITLLPVDRGDHTRHRSQRQNPVIRCTGCGHTMQRASKTGLCHHCVRFGIPDAAEAVLTLPAAVPVTALDEQPAASSQQPAASSQAEIIPNVVSSEKNLRLRRSRRRLHRTHLV